MNVITASEIEMLIILSEDKYKDFKKSRKKPSDFCKENLRLSNVKSYQFVTECFNNIQTLLSSIKCIVKYRKLEGVSIHYWTC